MQIISVLLVSMAPGVRVARPSVDVPAGIDVPLVCPSVNHAPLPYLAAYRKPEKAELPIIL